MRRNSSNKGFTLIELLIVVVIIGILAAIAIPKFSEAREKAYISAMKADLKNLSTQQELYYSDAFTYAADATDADLGFSPSSRVSVASITGDADGWSASVTHEGLTGESCAVFYGDATAVTPATVAGVIACTTDPTS